MSKLPVISGRELVRVLEKVGYAVDRQHGSHIILLRQNPQGMTVVPDHRELDRGTLRAILRQADITPAQLTELLR
jgi:predicted RNA binding protein YcfA (HicA-like mRNA interferase family)